jgi:hypothetical protein
MNAAPPLWGWIESLGAIAFIDPARPQQAIPFKVLDLQEMGFAGTAGDWRRILPRLDPPQILTASAPSPSFPMNRAQRRAMGR